MLCKILPSSSFSPKSLDLTVSSIHGVSASSRGRTSPRCSSSRLVCCSSVPYLICNGGNRGFKIRAISTGETAGKEVEAKAWQ